MPTLPNLRALRESRALTQADLAKLCGTRQPAIARLEAGRPSRISTIRKLARVLRCRPADLIGEPVLRPSVEAPPLARTARATRVSPLEKARAEAERARSRGDAEDAERWETIAAAIAAAQAS
jgi:transcriptional regulator with XRE-family HTH domain